MKRQKVQPAPRTTIRKDVLRDILINRRRELEDEVQRQLRDGRAAPSTDVREDMEHADANNVADLEFTLLQMKGETLRRIDEALRRVETGTFGSCAVCGVEIMETRLRALPFAVRCIKCETTREQAKARRASDGDEGAGRITGLVPASKGPRDGAAWG